MTKEILELILAAAGIFLVIVLLYALLSPVFNKEDKTAESYFNSFKSQIKVADSGGAGEFFIWGISNDEDTEYYLAYLGDSFSVPFPKKRTRFVSLKKDPKNRVCICVFNPSKYENSPCNYCEDLDLPLAGSEEEDFVAGPGEKIRIVKEEKNYVFEKVR